METLYTVGYAGLHPRALVEEVVRLGALLVDVRLNPSSKEPAWNKRALDKMLGSRYVWAGAYFGNLSYVGGRRPVDHTINLKNPEPGIQAAVRRLQTQPIILLCVCTSHRECHRREVARLIYKRCGCRVVNLYPSRLTWEKREQLETFDAEPEQADLL